MQRTPLKRHIIDWLPALSDSALMDDEDGKITADGDKKPAPVEEIDVAPKKKRRFNLKNSLTEDMLLEEKRRLQEAAQKSDKFREEERRAANRLSAFQSRKRKVETIEQLRTSVTTMEGNVQRDAQIIADMRKELLDLQAENSALWQEVPLDIPPDSITHSVHNTMQWLEGGDSGTGITQDLLKIQQYFDEQLVRRQATRRPPPSGGDLNRFSNPFPPNFF